MGESIVPTELSVSWEMLEWITAEWGTPCYLYFPNQLSLAFNRFVEGVSAWGPHRIAYSVKTNPCFDVLSDLQKLGANAEVVSLWEYALALKAGFPAHRIVLNGPFKPDCDLKELIDNPPSIVNIDSLDELASIEEIAPTGSRVPVGLRLCPPQAGASLSRFGMEYNTGEFSNAVSRVRRSKRLELRAIHFHLGTQVSDARQYCDALRVVQEIWKEQKLTSEIELDIGGGFPYEHDRMLDDQTFCSRRFFTLLRASWTLGEVPSLIVEPGRVVAAPCFAILSTVLATKPRTKEPTIVVLDSGTNHNVMSAFFDHERRIKCAVGDSGRFRYCGPLCMEDDNLSGEYFGTYPKKGDMVLTLNAGSYSYSLSRTFIQPRPPIIRIENRGVFKKVARECSMTTYGLSGEQS